MIVGIIGPLDSGLKIQSNLKKIDSSLETKLYIREKAIEALEVIEECEKECDAIMFTGCGVYEAIKNKHDIKLPNVFVSKGGTSIIKAFWEIKDLGMKLDRFSIDVVENEILEDLLNEIEINPTEVYYIPFSGEKDETEYIESHIRLFEDKKVDTILTSFCAVYSELKRRGYPVFHLQPTIPQIRVSYEKLKTETALNRAQLSQIAVEILRFIDDKDTKENYYSNMIKKSEADKIIVDYVRNIQGSLFSFGRNEYVVFAHKGAVDHDLNYKQLFKLQKDIKSIGFALNVGIGIGITAYQAETNAYKALNKHIDSKEFDIFSVDENDNIKGPLGSADILNYPLVSSDENIIDISEKTGLSCESISKLMAISETRKSKIYDTKELANYLDISERSARRILNKIISSDLGRIYAKETSSGGGRPKNLVEILF